MKFFSAILLGCFALPLAAQDCHNLLGRQRADTASLKQVEDRWDEAFTHGNADYLDCLLVPNYASVSPKGVHDKKWELEHARQNKGSATPVVNYPGMTYEIFGNTAIVRLRKAASADGKQPASYSSDVFAFEDGAWRALYSQHTNLEGGT